MKDMAVWLALGSSLFAVFMGAAVAIAAAMKNKREKGADKRK